MNSSAKPIFIAGATGYIGGRLVPRLLAAGYRVRVLARDPEKLRDRPWALQDNLVIIKGDVLDLASLQPALEGCRAAYYLVHSMNPEVKDFSATDRRAAKTMAVASAAANLEQIIYLGGLGEVQSNLSHHLQSRTEVGDLLRLGPVPVTILRAAMIIGSGSASFEILRYLVDRLPIMITPRWVNTPCQPIGVGNVLHYLIGCLEHQQVIGQTFDIGQAEVLDYRQLMEIYAEEAGLPRRWILPVPVLTPRLSSYWIHLVTPAPAALAQPLAEGLSNPVVCQEKRITELLPQDLFTARQAISLALDGNKPQNLAAGWADEENLRPAEWSHPGDPAWSGGSHYSETRSVVLNGHPEDIWPAVSSIGGEFGYSSANWLWQIRGLIDRVCGGVGCCRGRRSSAELSPGDNIDFWQVLAVKKPEDLVLSAEMKVPGVALLSFRLQQLNQGQTKVQQTARFLPRGLFGILYWYTVRPFHHFLFSGILRGIAAAAVPVQPMYFEGSLRDPKQNGRQ